MTEAEFLSQVIQLARLYHWRVSHFRPGRTARGGWRTAVQGDAGFPDLVLVRERVVMAELKVGRNKTTPEQDAWLRAFNEAGVLAVVWRPEDWNEIREILEE